MWTGVSIFLSQDLGTWVRITFTLPQGRHLTFMFGFFFLFCFVLFFLSLMTKSQAQMVSLVLKPLKPNLDLISWPNCCFNHSQRHHLNQPVCNFLVNTNELISHTGPPPNPQRTGTLHDKNLCHPFCPKWGPDLLLIAPVPHLHPPPMKTFHFYNPL